MSGRHDSAEAAPLSGLAVRSRISAGGELELSLEPVAVPEPAPDEVVVRVEATPINPSDLGLLLGPADLSTARRTERAGRPVVAATLPGRTLEALAARLNVPMPVGNEGAGVVVEAGAGVADMMGKAVAMFGGAMWRSTGSSARRTAWCSRRAPSRATARPGT